jgi:hypothetical protein
VAQGRGRAPGFEPVGDVALGRQIRQGEHLDAGGHAMEGVSHLGGMLAARIIVVREYDTVRPA